MKAQLIQERIHEVRHQKAMLDFDLAQLYEVETRILKQATKRNVSSFPRDFMFRLIAKEWKEILLSQILIIDNLENSSQIVMSSLKHRVPNTTLSIYRAWSNNARKYFKMP